MFIQKMLAETPIMRIIECVISVLLIGNEHCTGQISIPQITNISGTALIQWTIPVSERSSVIYAVKEGTPVLYADPSNQYKIFGSFMGRVNYTGDMENGYLSFRLSNVTDFDSGMYECGRNGPTDIIAHCGQSLIVTGKPTSPQIDILSPVEIQRNISLRCATNSTTMPADHNLLMTYKWERNGKLRSNDQIYTFMLDNYETQEVRCKVHELRGLQAESEILYISAVKECPADQYGLNCNGLCSERNCVKSTSSCDHITGACAPGGCKQGYRLPDCVKECSAEHYGLNCSMFCSERKCVESTSSCDHITGACALGGCEQGYRLPDCVKECEHGVYGFNCTQACNNRNCRNHSDICDHKSGVCLSGCTDGWIGDDCSKENGAPGKDTPEVNYNVWSRIIIGVVFGILIIVVVIVVMYIKRRNITKNINRCLGNRASEPRQTTDTPCEHERSRGSAYLSITDLPRTAE